LRNELNDIKKHLLFGAGSKKEEIISNLRDTIKKEDGEIRELRVKQEILTKKNSTLQTMLDNKEEEIHFLAAKMAQMDTELTEYRHKNNEKLENLKERTLFIMKSYSELEAKTNKQEFEWLAFKEHWIEQKSMYLDRIKFLEDYISRSQ
jgi:chromosome segregation ATPase